MVPPPPQPPPTSALWEEDLPEPHFLLYEMGQAEPPMSTFPPSLSSSLKTSQRCSNWRMIGISSATNISLFHLLSEKEETPAWGHLQPAVIAPLCAVSGASCCTIPSYVAPLAPCSKGPVFACPVFFETLDPARWPLEATTLPAC